MNALEWVLAVCLAIWAVAVLGPVVVDALGRWILAPLLGRRRHLRDDTDVE